MVMQEDFYMDDENESKQIMYLRMMGIAFCDIRDEMKGIHHELKRFNDAAVGDDSSETLHVNADIRGQIDTNL